MYKRQVEYFVQKSAANGIDIIRIFDCLNDLRNLKTAVKAANKEKAHAQVALSYTLGDAYTLEYWTNIAKEIEAMGADSICIKDMAGLLLPYQATELVGALKDAVKIPIDLHTQMCIRDRCRILLRLCLQTGRKTFYHSSSGMRMAE